MAKNRIQRRELMQAATDPAEDLAAGLIAKDDGDQKNGTPAAADVKTSDVDGGGAATDTQKKMKRAERFGMPVHLSEEEKRNSRA